jgi:hypothetical protein
MKTRIKHIILFAFFILLTFTACQDERMDIENPTEQEIFVPNSTLSNLMSRATAHSGISDNILDESDCFSVELPVTIIVSDVTIIIETEDDLEQLQDLFDDFNGDEDFLDFIFPITIIFNDYSELVIENQEQLENFINECSDEDVIECVDFVYPISFSVFNSQFNIIDTVTIENDEALYIFLDELEDNENVLIVSLNYPVALEYANGDTIEVNTNEELAEAIEAAGDDCEEEDECIEEEVALNLVECPWEVFLYTNDDLENLDGPYNFTFTENGSVIIEGVFADPYTTTWEFTETDNGLELNIASFYYYEQQFGNWLVVECDDDDLKFEHLTVDGTGLFFEQDCEDDLDCSLTDISGILQECPWDFSDGTGNFDNHQMVFHPDGSQQITEGETTVAIGGIWALSATDNGLILTFSELTAFQDSLGGEWLIVECNDYRIEIVRGDTMIVLEQDCENDEDVFNCFTDFELVECINAVDEAEFNLSANTVGLVNCTESFIASFHTSVADAEGNLGAISNTESYFSTQGQVYLRIEAESGNFEIFTIYLNTEECNLFECFENIEIVVCDNEDDANDGFVAFNLNSIYANCPEDNIVLTFHVAISDAEAANNALVSPFVNTTNPQTIYARAELAGDASIYDIFEVGLIVEDCNQNSCTEGDVDGILTECIWNAVNYNGSDNLMEYNFDFETNSQILVIYTDNQTIDATWSTSQSAAGVIITFSNVAGPNIQAITGEWLVVECEANRLELHRENDILVLERTCQ